MSDDGARPAIHTENAYRDVEAIATVSALLARTRRTMPKLDENDKWPNTDGIVQLTDAAGVPSGILEAQVKTLHQRDLERLSYTFSSDKFMEYCKRTPEQIVLFIGVDIDRRVAYWVHVSPQAVAELQGSRTIALDAKQTISATDSAFVDEWQTLATARRLKLAEYDKLKAGYAALTEMTSAAYGRQDARFVAIHDFLDVLNSELDGRFSLVKRRMYPGSWKLGFAFRKYDADLAFTLYPVAKDFNDVLVKEINGDQVDGLTRRGLGFTWMTFNHLATDPPAFARSLVRDRLVHILAQRLLDHDVSEDLAREYVFAYVNGYAPALGMVKGAQYDVDTLRNAFSVYMPVWLEETFRSPAGKRLLLGPDSFLDIRFMLAQLSDAEMQEIDLRVRRRIENGETTTQPFVVGDRELHHNIFLEGLTYCKRVGRLTLEPLWPGKKFEGSSGWIWSVWTPQDLKVALETYFSRIHAAYADLVRRNFPDMVETLAWRQPDLRLVLMNIDRLAPRVTGETPGSFPSVRVYSLCKLSPSDEPPEIAVMHASELPELSDRVPDTKQIRWRDSDYEIQSSWHSMLGFICSDTPMLNGVYDQLTRRIRTLLGKSGVVPEFTD